MISPATMTHPRRAGGGGVDFVTLPKKRDMVLVGASVVYSEGCRSRRTQVVNGRVEQQGYAASCEYQTGPNFLSHLFILRNPLHLSTTVSIRVYVSGRGIDL